ncbi:hypothetical protein BN159_0367 [Streptomyces davaonensis JCM 4913]|uniref:Uncharacterized protein n=1 Tax=Streptomyces davaonensis (strain DSM 101723 / JCM 4913 / KCC S-0913 / 768) TaxID=1214101 RepID=K4QSJ2_STRDJ|nr:hypothetical protein [Streptomyces davaonensis]CCK24746.1 hypothetical protein BN159_0367 [Streptomyces davaonensis JCM 4913]
MSDIRTDLVVTQSVFTATINAPLNKIDIAKWLFALPNAEYRRCAPGDHIACGSTVSDDGQPMSINVEQVGPTLMIQHYIGEITGPHHCRMVSLSDLFTPFGRYDAQVIWDLSVRQVDDDHCEFTNAVTAHPTIRYLAALEEHGVAFGDAIKRSQPAGEDHNRRETPLFAASIERAARTGA